MKQRISHPTLAVLAGVTLLFLLSLVITIDAEGADLILSADYDATGDETWDTVDTNAYTYYTNGYDIECTDLIVDTGGKLDLNGSSFVAGDSAVFNGDFSCDGAFTTNTGNVTINGDLYVEGVDDEMDMANALSQNEITGSAIINGSFYAEFDLIIGMDVVVNDGGRVSCGHIDTLPIGGDIYVGAGATFSVQVTNVTWINGNVTVDGDNGWFKPSGVTTYINGSVTLNGLCDYYGMVAGTDTILGAVTINSGAIYQASGTTTLSSSLTINSGGTYEAPGPGGVTILNGEGVTGVEIFPVGDYFDWDGDYSLHGALSVCVSGDYVYTVSPTDHTLAVFDISGHGNPVPVGSYTDYGGDYSLNSAYSVYVSGDYAYTVSLNDATLAVWDISGHGDPVPVGTYTKWGGDNSLTFPFSVFASGDYAYTASYADATLAVWDISGHGNPVPVGSYTDSSGAYSLDGAISIFVSGDYAYVAASMDNTLSVFDISGHGDPVPVGSYTDSSGAYSLEWINSVFVSGDYAYTVSYMDDTLAVFDISGHGDPVPVGTYTDSSGAYSLDNAYSVFVSGDYAYTTSFNDHTLAVFDISGHGNPVPVASYTDITGDFSLQNAGQVFVSGNYVYTVSSGCNNLAVFEIQSPSVLTCEGTLSHNQGTFNITAPDTKFITGGESFYDLNVIGASVRYHDDTTIDHDLRVESTTAFKANENTEHIVDLTVTGNVIIAANGVFGGLSAADYSFGSLRIESSGVFHSTSETLSITSGNLYKYTGGEFYHNNGEVFLDYLGGFITGQTGIDWTFYDLTNNENVYTIAKDIFVENTLKVVGSGDRLFPASVTITMGTDSSAGTIENNGGIYGSSNNQDHKFYAKNENYPFSVTGNQFYWSYRTDSEWFFKWANFSIDVDTSNGGANAISFQLDGNCEFDALTISVNDTLDLNSYKLTSSSTVTLESGATLVPHGEIEATLFEDWNALSLTSQTFILENTTTANIHGDITINSGSLLDAPSGELVCNGTFDNNIENGYIHNQGTYRMNNTYPHRPWTYGGPNTIFWNMNVSSTYWCYYTETITIINEWSTILSESRDRVDSYANIYLGSNTQSCSVYGKPNLYGSTLEIYAVSESYYAIFYDGFSGPIWSNIRIKWLDVREDISIHYAVRSVGLYLEGDCIFKGVNVGEGETFGLNGYSATINGTFITTGTLTTGSISEIHLTANASWDMNQNVTLAEFEVDGTLTIPEGTTITFTATDGFSNSTGTIDITGVYGNLVYLTGVPHWRINGDAIEYFWKYVNITHGNNTGSSPIVALGEGYDLEGLWDFQAPLITPHFISEGLFLDTRYSDTLRLDWTAEDMAFLYGMNITITDWQGSSIFSNGINASTFGETAAYRWNISGSIEDLAYGRLTLNYTASDAHNTPASTIARKNADAMLCDLAGELVGHPSGKDKTDKHETNTIKFKKSGAFVSDLFDIEFLMENKGSQHVVKWTGDNFKMSHWVKLYHGTSAPMRITADSIEHIVSKEFGSAHFLINGQYFYDALDFEATGGKILFLDRGTIDGKEYVTISFTHPDWKKGGGWGFIDPLTGAINSRSVYYNISVGTIPEVVAPGEHAKLPGDSTSTVLKVRVYGAGNFSGTVHFYNDTGVLLGSQHNVTNNTVAILERNGLEKNTLYSWYTVFSIGGENFTGPTWDFLTGGLEAKKAPPGPGRERYGDSISDPFPPVLLILFLILITLIVLLRKLWYGGEVNKS